MARMRSIHILAEASVPTARHCIRNSRRGSHVGDSEDGTVTKTVKLTISTAWPSSPHLTYLQNGDNNLGCKIINQLKNLSCSCNAGNIALVSCLEA